MTRDPSDGTVREKNSGGESGCARKCVEADDSGGSGIDRNSEVTTQGDRPVAVVKVPPPEAISGLPTDNLKPDEAARLEKSRDWLKQRFNRRSPDSGEG